MTELLLPFFSNYFLCAQELDGTTYEIVEIECFCFVQCRLVPGVHVRSYLCRGRISCFGEFVRTNEVVFGRANETRNNPHRERLFIDMALFHNSLYGRLAICFIIDDIISWNTDILPIHPQQSYANRVKSTDVGHKPTVISRLTEQFGYPLTHFPRCFVCKRDRENTIWRRLVSTYKICNTMRQRFCFAATRTCLNQKWPLGCFDRTTLFWIKASENIPLHPSILGENDRFIKPVKDD